MTHPADAVSLALLGLAGSAPDANGVRMGAGALDGVRIFDGPPLAAFDELEALAIGTAITDVPVASGSTRQGYGGRRDEQFDLSCIAQCWSGDTSLTAARARVYVLRAAVGSLLADDPTVGDACSYARLTRWSYRPFQNDQGALALLEFTARIDATRFEGA